MELKGIHKRVQGLLASKRRRILDKQKFLVRPLQKEARGEDAEHVNVILRYNEQ
jgi:hypothetical protein